MSGSTKRFLKRKGSFLLLLLAVCVCAAFLVARYAAPAPKKEGHSAFLQEASDRAHRARNFVLHDLLERAGIGEEDITAAHYGFSVSETCTYHVGFAYRQNGQEKLYGYRIQVDESNACTIERSGEALGQKLMSVETEEAADNAV